MEEDNDVKESSISVQSDTAAKMKEYFLGCGQAKYLTSEVSGVFTGVIMALYAVGENTARFREFYCRYAATERE